ncbi:MAG: phosphatidate cytidylyltransferase [Candidatus Hodarchaeota archaeon]
MIFHDICCKYQFEKKNQYLEFKMFYFTSLPVTIAFWIYGAITVHHAFSLKNAKDKETLDFIKPTTYINELMTAGLFFSSGLLHPFILLYSGLKPNTINFLYIFSTIIIFGGSSIWYIWGTMNYFKCKKDPEELKKRLDEEAQLLEKHRLQTKLPMSADLKRKFLHVVIGIVVITAQLLSILVKNFGWLDGTGFNREVIAISIEMIIGYLFVFMIHYADTLRLYSYQQLPKWAKRWFFSSIGKEEMKTFVSSNPLVLTLTPFLLAPIPIFINVALVSALADAAAGLIGRKYGKKRFPKNSPKTIEGYIAGMACTFVFVILFSILFNFGTYSHFIEILVAAIVATAVFLLVDIFCRDLSDNILNPILTGAALMLVYFYF